MNGRESVHHGNISAGARQASAGYAQIWSAIMCTTTKHHAVTHLLSHDSSIELAIGGELSNFWSVAKSPNKESQAENGARPA
jgi:hypothetical protein